MYFFKSVKYEVKKSTHEKSLREVNFPSQSMGFYVFQNIQIGNTTVHRKYGGYIPHCCVYSHQIHEVNMRNKTATTPYYYPA